MSEDRAKVESLIAELTEAIETGRDTMDVVIRFTATTRALGLIELFNRGEYEKMAQVLPPDHIHDMRPVGIPGMSVYRGREEYLRFIEAWIEAFPDAQLQSEFDFEITDPVDAGFGIVAQVVRGGSSGIPVAFRYAWIGESSDKRSESIFGSDIEAMRKRFRDRFGQDPGPFDLKPLDLPTKQEA